MEKVFITEKSTHCKTSLTLKIDAFEIPDNKNIGKVFSKYELFFLHKANSSSDPSQILILKFLILRTPLTPLTFTISNWNFYLTQFWLCSILVSLFCPTPFDHTSPQVLDITNHFPSPAKQIYYQAICRS